MSATPPRLADHYRSTYSVTNYGDPCYLCGRHGAYRYKTAIRVCRACASCFQLAVVPWIGDIESRMVAALAERDGA